MMTGTMDELLYIWYTAARRGPGECPVFSSLYQT